MSNIASYFKDDLSLIKRGEEHLRANHLVAFTPGDKEISATMEPSFGPKKKELT